MGDFAWLMCSTSMATKRKKGPGKGKAAVVDVDAALLGAASAPAKKGRRDIPVIEGHGALADRMVEKIQALKEAKAKAALLEAEILGLVAPEYERRAKSGDFTKSVNVRGEDSPGVQVTWKDKFGVIPLDEEAALKGALGDKYARHFERKREVKVRDLPEGEMIAVLADLLKHLGQERFAEVFTVKLGIVSKADMDREQFGLPEDVRALLKQEKASVKVQAGKK